MSSWQELIKIKLIDRQLECWPLAADNYAGLQKLQRKTFDMGDFAIDAQFNPGRIRSAAARLDAEALLARPCFLCAANQPREQLSIEYPPGYLIELNPYPLFYPHLTISDKRHLPQRIDGRLDDFLRLAEDLPDYALLYNGPACGASAPDHFHFQAIPKGALPVNLQNERLLQPLRKGEKGTIFRYDRSLRKIFLLESQDREWMIETFSSFCRILGTIRPQQDEPMMNLQLQFSNKSWRLFIYPRKLHRPSHFYEEGEGQLLISPGIIDMAGSMILVRQEDFGRMDSELLADIYSQISISDEEESQIIKQIIEL